MLKKWFKLLDVPRPAGAERHLHQCVLGAGHSGGGGAADTEWLCGCWDVTVGNS